MSSLEKIRSSVERLILAISNSLRLEIAIFDKDSKLFFCTPTYLKKKGNIVHAPSLWEVIENGNILVNTPGEMPSCIGCRFKEHCPSTIEVLCCIRLGTSVSGVISFTSFTRDGQRRITENTPIYLDAITELSKLLGDMLAQEAGESSLAGLDSTLSAAMEISTQPLLLTDPHGVILQYNQMAGDFLKFCNMSSSSLWQLFPEAVVRKIMEGNDLFEKNVTIRDMSAKISTRAVYQEGQIKAFFVRLSDELYEPISESGFVGNIVGMSPETESIHKFIKKVAGSSTPILITGETGTGKELAARAIHEQSKRNKYSFIAVNCSSIPEALFESELFGYEEGSFTGAKKGGKIGKIELAQGGTLFLDEIGEMPLSAQPKLLRVLQEYELERVGSTKKVHLDIRVIAATNKDLADMVAEHTFRSDLYYRVNVINLQLPPLRDRKSDIIPIATNYLNKLGTRMNTSLKTISPEAEGLFLSYSWPGNVRELQNVIERAANLCESESLSPDDFPDTLRKITPPPQKKMIFSHVQQDNGDKELIFLLEKYGHTLEGKKQIAAELRISLRTLYRRIHKAELRQYDVALPH